MNGMDDNEDEHNFSDDDDFGSLPFEALEELEHNAILSTQHVQQPGPRRPAPLNTSNAPHTVGRQNVVPQLQRAIADGFEQDSFDAVEEDRVPTPVEHIERPTYRQTRPPGETTQREQARMQKYGRPPVPARPQVAPQVQARVSHRPAAVQSAIIEANALSRTFANTPTSSFGAMVQDRPTNTNNDPGVARIEELLKEREALMAQLKDAKDQVMTNIGEISIIRDNRDKETKIYDRQLVAVKKSMQEESARHKTAIEALTSKHNSLVTEYNMTKDDLKEETRRTRTLETRLKDKPAARQDDLLQTPKKQRPGNSLRDGFDDDEIMFVSPAKSASRRSQPNTPTAANKRKRKIDPSPVKPLVLRQSEDAQRLNHDSHRNGTSSGLATVTRKDRQTERHLKLIQKIMSYQPKFCTEKLIEVLVTFKFPSDSKQAFSAIVLNAVSRLQGPELPAQLLQIFIDLWSQSLREKYFDCIGLLLEVVEYIVDIRTSVIERNVITNLLVVLQETATINGSARFKHSPVSRMNFGQFRQTPASALNPLIDTTACMALLYKIAGLSLDSESLIDHFWRSMTTDFVLMMLNSWQPIADITLMLHLLATSIMQTTFGNICADPSSQSAMESHIIRRVSYLLWETPKVDEGLPNPSRSDICRFRLEALALMSNLAIDSSLPPHDDPHHHGSIVLASHSLAIALLVRALYDAVAGLYLMTTSSPLYSQIINRGVRLLYHLMTLHGEEIDLQQKLAAVNGGVHKHRVVLTRLAFSEGWFIDSEVSDETCAMATAMLEDSVTPDEAEMMIQAFPGFNGRKKDKLPDQVRQDDGDETMIE